MGVELPDDIINFLANRIRTNIRRLEGALIRVASYASLTGKKLTLEVVEGLLREVLHEEGRFSINIEVIQKKVAEHFDIRLADMTSKRRPENIAFPVKSPCSWRANSPKAPSTRLAKLLAGVTTARFCTPVAWSKTGWKSTPTFVRS